jgi:dolichyl-phosphate beta-glucosyltransferase
MILANHVQLYFAVVLVAPDPRAPRSSEKKYLTILPDGKTSEARELPCWIDGWRAKKELARRKGDAAIGIAVEEPEIFMSVVVPAYNEEERMGGMLEEAVEFLQREYGDAHASDIKAEPSSSAKRKTNGGPSPFSTTPSSQTAQRGWEILIISDGSTDKTVETALAFAKDHQLSQYPPTVPGPWIGKEGHSTHIPHGSIRIITLEENRGKGGAVTHGMRHVRGKYAVFADADGASKFEDLSGLVKACEQLKDSKGRAVAIGSRAHLVGSEAVVKVCSPFSDCEITTKSTSALNAPQLPDAQLPPAHPPDDSSGHLSHQRHTVRLQTLLTRFAARHNTLHAFGRLDF